MTVIEVKCHHFLSILMNILESAGKKALHNHVGEKNDLKKYETTTPPMLTGRLSPESSQHSRSQARVKEEGCASYNQKI